MGAFYCKSYPEAKCKIILLEISISSDPCYTYGKVKKSYYLYLMLVLLTGTVWLAENLESLKHQCLSPG